MKRALLLWTVVMIAASCTGLGPYTGSGPAIVTTAGAVPEGMVRARLAAFDGKPLPRGTRRLSFEAGSHRINVWPANDSAWRDDETAYSMSMEFDAQPGAAYSFAVTVRRYRTAVHDSDGALLDQTVWQTVFIPVLVDSTDPAFAQTRIAAAD